MSRRVSFGSDAIVNEPTSMKKAAAAAPNIGDNYKKRLAIGLWSIRLLKSSNAFYGDKLARIIRKKMSKAVRLVSTKRSSPKVSSSTLPRSRSYAETLDTHRAEAIEDCIDFLNSSSCLQKSKSTS